jgi:hypothetical protein
MLRNKVLFVVVYCWQFRLKSRKSLQIVQGEGDFCIFLMFSSLSMTFLILPLILQRAVAIDANELGVLILILKLDFETCLMIA